MKTSGPAATGLTFIWMPLLFAKMAFGKPLAILFFLGLSFAGFSSLISMLELAVRNLIDFGVKRSTAVMWIVGASFILGIPSAMSLEILGDQDFVWSVGLIISGVLMAIAAIKYGLPRIMDEVSSESQGDWPFPSWWPFIVKYIAPMVGIVLVTWWMIESPSFFVTCLTQWGIILIIFYMFFVHYLSFSQTVKVIDNLNTRNKIIKNFFIMIIYNFSIFAAQYLNSGIFPYGSKAGLVKRLAADSL